MGSDIVENRNPFGFPSEGDNIEVLLNRRREYAENLASNKFLSLVREELVENEGCDFFIFKKDFGDM